MASGELLPPLLPLPLLLLLLLSPGVCMEVAASAPVVSVPVLSKAAVLQAASASSTLPPVTRMPLPQRAESF
jgi:hypothetical protein